MEFSSTAAVRPARIATPSSAFFGNLRRSLLRIPVGEMRLRRRHADFFGRAWGSSPGLFTDKLFRRMIALNRWRDPLMTRLADKFRVRAWVAERIGEQYLSKVYWDGASPQALPFDQLPERCVIKTNHGSGQVIIKNGLLDRASVVSRLNSWLGQNYYWCMRERQYLEIAPHILVEEFLESGEDCPLDYRFWCFDGHVAAVQVDNHSHSICPFYDTDWQLLDLTYRSEMKQQPIEKPEGFERMLAMASTLSSGFKFVRVDLYNIAGRIVFGEMTFTPAAGQLPFPRAWDERLGALWK